MAAGLAAASVAGLLAAGLAAVGPAEAKPAPGTRTGTGRVFMVNPVQSSGDQTLTDSDDAASAVPASAYAMAPLRNLDGSGYLRGRWVTVESATGTPAYSATGRYAYDRHQDQFEQVMGYFWVNQTQEYLQSLGFGSTLPGVLDEQFTVKINQYGGDNSYQTDKPYRIRLGKGGVDDAEDAEVIVHEYGHAVHADQVPGYGQSLDAGAIGESFGDYLAVTVGLAAAKQYGWPVRAEEACPMDWDASSYTAAPHCIRRFDRNLTLAERRNQVHYDGQIWSQALWEIRKGYAALGLTSRAWDTTLVLSQFDYAADTSFSAAAADTYRAALARDGKRAAALVKDRFAARGITF
ncbi:bacillolysin [Nocardioides sp. HDW12B]|nr:bacillolysin [Nocardioides sp. HDW12B]